MLAGGVRPGDVVAVVGAGPVGLAAITGARLYSPGHIVAIDLPDARLEAARQFGADITVNNAPEDPLAVIKDLGLDREKVNPNGGAIALGHPIAATGAVITTKILYEMGRRRHDLGLVTLCIGGGQGIAMLIARN